MTKARPYPVRNSTILVRPAPGKPNRALVQMGPLRIRAAIGRAGRSAFKREGDGATPITAMRLLYGFSRGDRVKALHTALPMRRIAKDMLWCDQPEHPAYNKLVKAPFKPSHEEMMRKDGLYDVCLVMDWNITSRRRHGGSAIFFHLIRPGYEPTAGCIAVSLRDMKRMIGHLKKGTLVRVM